MSEQENKICGHELRLMYAHGKPYGIRDRSGYLLFFTKVQRYQNQDERFRRETAQKERFAKYVLEALERTPYEDREKLAKFMLSRGYATGHGDTVEDLLNELGPQIDESISAGQQSKWIPVSERLPELGESVDVWIGDRKTGWYLDHYSPTDMRLFWYTGRGNIFGVESIEYRGDEHWMPLPKGPDDE